jgi:hypothetical protein
MAKLTLYPTSDSDVNLTPNTGSDNYALVDELCHDDDTTYVETSHYHTKYDLYGLSNRPTTGDAGTINSVRVFARVKRQDYGEPYAVDVSLGVKSGTTTDWSTYLTHSTDNAYLFFSNEWTTNPDTSSAWTWSEIDSLIAGVKLHTHYSYAKCTQVWVQVDYDLPSGETLRPTSDDDVNLSTTGTDHYTEVDEAVLDTDDGVYQWQDNTFKKDIYGLGDHSTGSGTINSVTVVGYLLGGIFGFGYWAYAKFTLDVDGTEYVGQEQYVRALDYHSQTWDENPDTETDWTWDDIDALKAGIYLKCAGTSNWYDYCYQFYVIVNYTEVGGHKVAKISWENINKIAKITENNIKKIAGKEP